MKECAKRVAFVQTLQRLNEQAIKPVARAPSFEEMLTDRIEPKANDHGGVDHPEVLLLARNEEAAGEAQQRCEVRRAGYANALLDEFRIADNVHSDEPKGSINSM